MIIDFGLAELDPTYIGRQEQKLAKMRETNDPQLKT